jgi:hypothetical protein
MLSNDEIIFQLQSVLDNSKFELLSFDRNHQFFGNMIVVIGNEQKKYQFVTDRGQIFCNDSFLLDNNYHIAGQDDTPIYLIKEIEKIVRTE